MEWMKGLNLEDTICKTTFIFGPVPDALDISRHADRRRLGILLSRDC